MCIAIQEIREEGKIEGKIEGAIMFAKEFGISREQIKGSLMAKFEKNEEEAEELLDIYWK